MNIRSTIKSLPVIGILALGLALSSNAAMADKGDRDGHKGNITQQFSHQADKSHNNTGKYTKRYKERRYNRNDHRKGHKDRSRKYYSSHNGHKHKSHNNHAHRDNHRHGYRGHSHSHNVVNHHDHYVGFDDLRFMVGLHTDRFDIILRD